MKSLVVLEEEIRKSVEEIICIECEGNLTFKSMATPINEFRQKGYVTANTYCVTCDRDSLVTIEE